MTRILLVDDEVAITEVIEEVLARAGFAVTVTYDGESALEAARESRPDLVLSDLMMPRVDGVAFAQGMRAIPELATVPFILMTAAYVLPSEARALDIEVLRKPFDARALLSTIHRALENSKSQSQSQSQSQSKSKSKLSKSTH